MGVRAVTLYDTKKATPHDLSTQFYLGEADVGRGRARACLERLRALNPNVTVEVAAGPLAPPLVAQHAVVVLTGELKMAVGGRWVGGVIAFINTCLHVTLCQRPATRQTTW